MQIFSYSDAGFAMTRGFEGLRLKAYQDVAGVWTIGFGHVAPDVVAGMMITEAEAETLLHSDLAAAVTCVNRTVTAKISQAQFDAMVDFCFNAGRGSFVTSTLLRDLNKGDVAAAAAQFGLWVHAGGKVVPGLVRRRTAEETMFSAG